jgi:serine/threonine-protein kinase
MVRPAALAQADGDPFIGMIVGGRYAILEILGAGSMGTVYRARHEAMRRDLALKIVRSERLVDPQAKSRFQQEAQATSLLTSPHTVTVFDFGEIHVDETDDRHMISGSLFLAMELLEGESLGNRLKRVKRLAPKDAVRIVRDALASLGEAHGKGVIHRDLKPDNLLLVRGPDGDERCKVLDFGIAKVLTREKGVDALETQAGTVFGTPRYMSPEQAQGKALDARSDLYSLGVILYHMVLGKPPYTDGDAVVVMAHHIKTVPKRPTVADPELALPQDLEDLLMRVLDKNPQNRPQSASEFVAELDQLGPLTTLSPQGTNASGQLAAVVGPRDPARSRRVLFAGAGAAALLGLIAAIALTRSTVASGVEGGRDATLPVIGSAPATGWMATERMAPPSATPSTPAPQPPTDAPAPSQPEGSSATDSSAPMPSAWPSASPKKPSDGPRGYERFDER